MTKKQLLSRISNFALILLCIYTGVVLYQRWIARDERQSQTAPSFSALSMTNSLIELPLKDNKPSILVFWATWCGPCEMELARLKKAVDDKEIPADRVFAVSLGETLEIVQQTLKERGYPFQVVADERGRAGELYKIRVTPTVVHVDKDQNMAWVAEGLHPLSGTKAKSHLNN